MSSYQFVNSLASCYSSNQTVPQVPNLNRNNHESGDYYAQSANFNTSCYTQNQVHYGPQNPYPQPQLDYTQLQTQRLNLHQAQSQAVSQSQSQSQSQPQPPTGGAQIHSSQISESSNNLQTSCKYADLVSSNALIPQDLTTSNVVVNSNNNLVPRPLSSPLKNTPSSPSIKPSAVSPSSSTSSSTSSSHDPNSVSVASGKNTGSNSSNPPQIYPWMKRVHLGQSKFLKLFLIKTHGSKMIVFPSKFSLTSLFFFFNGHKSASETTI